MQNRRLGVCASSIAIVLLVSFTLSARAWGSETVVFDFSGSDGSQPYGGLISDSKGNLYGTTYTGGAYEGGTVFELVYQGGTKYSEKVLYSFTGGGDGGFPTASLVLDSSLNLYGTTELGGTGSCSGGCGVVFELSRSSGYKTETVLHSFLGSDGESPVASLIFDSSSNLYGTTLEGGAYGAGAVFELVFEGRASYSEKVLYSFTGGKDGGYPNASLVFDKSFNLYSITRLGGSASGNCEGSGSGCGVVFELSKSSGYKSESVLYSFTGESDGGEPFAFVTLDKLLNLYGTTYMGGNASCSGGCGVVFELSRSSGYKSETVLHRFTGRDGAQPTAGLAFDSQDAHLYGTTFGGGTSGLGTVFRIQKSGSGFTSLHSFRGGNDGAYPYAGLGLGFAFVGKCTGRCGPGTTINGDKLNDGTVIVVYFGATE